MSEYRGDAWIAGGMRGLGEGVHEYLADRRQQSREREQNLAMASMLRDWAAPEQAEGGGEPADAAGNAMPPREVAATQGRQAKALRNLGKAFGLNSDHLEGLSNDQLKGLLKGYVMLDELEQRNLQRQDHALRMADWMANRQARARADAIDELGGEIAGAYLQELGQPKPVTPGPGEGYGPVPGGPQTAPGAWQATLRQYPGAPAGAVGEALRALGPYLKGAEDDETRALPPLVTEGPFPGIKFAQDARGRGGLHVVQDPGAMQVMTVPDAAGNPRQVLVGRGGAQQLREEKGVPETYHRTMDAATAAISEAQVNLDLTEEEIKSRPGSPEPKLFRDRNRRALELAQKQAKATVDRYHSTGALSDAQRDRAYEELGLKAPARAATPASAEERRKLIDEANAAIRAGKDRAAVLRRLQELGVEVK